MNTLIYDLRYGLRMFVWAVMACSVLGLVLHAKAQTAEADRPIDAATRQEVIETTLKLLRENYIFPDVAQQIEQAIREQIRKKAYDSISNPETFAQRLTAELQTLSHDKHMSVKYSREALPPPSESKPTVEEREERLSQARLSNFGFDRVERLPGNVGYLNLNIFWWLDVGGGDTAVAAMNFIANTSALIIDLRSNRGGDPAMVVLLASYFFENEPVELTSIFSRASENNNRTWTLPYVPGQRYLGKDVYILTSTETFSAGEAFAYDLKNLKRATVFGESTGGGANPRTGYPVKGNHFIVFVPTGRAVSPITKTNWEGTGVKPDIEVPADLALKTAHLAALKKLRDTNSKVSAKELKISIESLEKELDHASKRN